MAFWRHSHGLAGICEGAATMNVLIIVIAALCFVYLVYAMLRPERF